MTNEADNTLPQKLSAWQRKSCAVEWKSTICPRKHPKHHTKEGAGEIGQPVPAPGQEPTTRKLVCRSKELRNT